MKSPVSPESRAAVEASKAFPKRLADLRIRYGQDIDRRELNATEFAEILGLEAETYRRYERAETQPNIATLALIRELTGVSLDSLIADMAPGRSVHAKPPTLADRLRWTRELMEPDAKAVADLLGLPLETWLRWESGEEKPDYEKLVEFATRFSVSLEFLLQGNTKQVERTRLGALLRLHPELLPVEPPALPSGSRKGSGSGSRRRQRRAR